MEAKEIASLVGRYAFEKGHSPITAGFQSDVMYECDVISVSKDGLTTEYEIKRSVADFKADFKKTRKHQWLKAGKGITRHKNGKVSLLICNYFYYVCLAPLIREEMVPAYAGLIWVYTSGQVKVVKKAPRLHEEKADERFIRKIAHNLTQKHLFDKAYMTLVREEKKEHQAELKKIMDAQRSKPKPKKTEDEIPKPKGKRRLL